MSRSRFLRRRGGESGQVLPITALVIVILMVAVAFAVDLSSLTNQKQELHDTLDSAAQAGAYELPNAAAAQTQALAFAATNDIDSVPAIDFWCIVGSTLSGGVYVVNTLHIPVTCNPGNGAYNTTNYPGLVCNETICAIPCDPNDGSTDGVANDQCNTIRVADSKLVPYHFAPVIGDEEGNTGNLVSVACKGSCGTLAPTPIDFAFVADRTGSMNGSCPSTNLYCNLEPLRSAIINSLRNLTPSLHHAAFGTIGQSSASAPTNCKSQAATTQDNSSTNGARWMPIGLTSNYDLSGNNDPPDNDLNTNSQLVQAVNCLGDSNTNGSNVDTGDFSGTGTELTAPFNAARRVLTGVLTPTGGLAPQTGTGVVKALVFMTDGEPNEDELAGGGVFSTNVGDSDGNTACSNLITASDGNPGGGAKDVGITVITIAFRLAGTQCDGGTGATSSGTGGNRLVVDVLAAVASPHPTSGAASSAANSDGSDTGNGGCSNASESATENADGDYFYCAASASDLASIYQTAVSAVSSGIRFIRLPS